MPYRSSYVPWSIALAALAAGLLLVLTGNGGDAGQRRGGFDRAVPVQVQTVAGRAFSDRIEAIGTAKANEAVVLTARVSETVQSVDFHDGMLVEKGTVLVELTNAEEKALVREAEANVKEAQQQFDRIADLAGKGTVSQSTADETVRALETARSRLAGAEARMADRVIRAPFSGILGLRSVSPGALVSPGEQITTLDDISLIKLDFQVPERFLSVLAPGLAIQASAAAFPGEEFNGVVGTVNSRIDPVSRAVTIRAELPNPDHQLRPGMLLTVELISNRRQSLAVPEGAIVPLADQKFVYVVGSDNKVKRVDVQTGARAAGYVEILTGIEAGQRVVSSGTMRLRPGIAVEIQNAEESAPVADSAGRGTGGHAGSGARED